MLRAGARIYLFPQRPARDGPADGSLPADNRLTIRDRLDLHGWGERIHGSALGCAVGRDGTGGVGHDFVQLHRAADRSVVWTFVRTGPEVTAWHGAHGPDLGTFPTLGEAIEAALAAVPYSYRKALRRPARRPAGTLPSPSRRQGKESRAGH